MKEPQTLLLGQQFKTYTYHKNLTYKFYTNIVLRWVLILEEYGQDIEYIQGKKNTVTDALSQLPNNGNQENTQDSNYIK